MRALFIFGVSLIAPYTLVHAESVTKEFKSADVRGLSVANGSGKITVTGSDSGKALVTADKIKFEKNCVLNMDQTGTALRIEVKQTSLFKRADCQVDIDIQIPRAVDLDLKTGSGSISVKGTKGKVVYRAGSGDVDFDAEIISLDGATGSGSVRAVGLTSNADLKVGSGSVNLVYSKKPESGKLNIEIGNGDATVLIPSNTKMTTAFKAGSGQLTNEIGDTPGAAFTIAAKAGSGNLLVKKGL